MKKYKIAVAGTGYVGLSIATLLSQHHHVTAVDIVPEKVEMINNRKSPIQDDYIEKYLAEKDLDLTATLDAKDAYSDRTLKLQCLETALFAMDPLARIIMFIYINWLFNSCFLGTIKIKERIFGETNIKNISRVMGGFCCFSCCGVGNGGIWKSSL